MTAGGRFTHEPMTEQVKFLENFIDSYTSFVIRTKPLHAKVMLSVEESSLVESKHEASLDSTHEPSPEPRTLKETMLHPSEFPIKFEDYGNISNYFGHQKHIHPSKEASPKVLSKEWLIEVKCSSEAI